MPRHTGTLQRPIVASPALLVVRPLAFHVLQVVSLRSSQLKAEQALADTSAAEAKLAEAAQQLGSVSAQLSTETARAQKLAGEIGAAKEAEKTALAKLAAAQTALEDQQKLASQRGGQVQHLSNQIDSFRTTMKNMTTVGLPVGIRAIGVLLM